MSDALGQVFGKQINGVLRAGFKSFAKSRGVKLMHSNPSRRLYFVGMQPKARTAPLAGVFLGKDGVLRDG